jgi:hypothetical protein
MTRNLPAAMVLAGTAGVVPFAGPLEAQVLGQSVLSATISQSFEVDDNLNLDVDSPGTSTFTDTRLSLGLLQETPTQRFTLGFDTGLRAIWEADEDFEFTLASPSTASAGFRQDWASGSFSTDFRVRQRRIDFLDDITFLDVVVDGEVIGQVPDDLARRTRDTTERRYDAAFRLDLATDSPSSYSFGVQASRTDFDEDALDLSERTTLRGNATWSLAINPVLSSFVRGNVAYDETEDADNTTIRSAGVEVGADYAISEILSVNAGVGYEERRREEDGETVEDDSGPTASVGLRYLVDDRVSVTASGRFTAAAPETRFGGDLRATYLLPDSTLTGRVSQDFTTSGAGDEIRITRVGIGFTRTLDALTNASFDVSYALQVNQDADVADITRTDFTAAVNRTIAPDVFATAGYRLRYRDEDGSATSNAVFFSIGRTFETPF